MVRFFAEYQAKCSFVRPVRLGMFRGTFQQYHDTESWYGIQYLDNGTIGRNGICICGIGTNTGPEGAGDGPQKWFSAVSCSNLALRILKLRREDFEQTGSSTFKIG